MFDLLSNMILYGSVIGSVVAIVVTGVKVVIRAAAAASVRDIRFPVPVAAKPTDVCLYCGFKIVESKCGYCGGSNPQFVRVEA